MNSLFEYKDYVSDLKRQIVDHMVTIEPYSVISYAVIIKESMKSFANIQTKNGFNHKEIIKKSMASTSPCTTIDILERYSEAEARIEAEPKFAKI